MENQENRRKNSGSNSKKNNHDKNKLPNDPNAKNKYKNNQDSTNKTKGRNDNKPYQYPPRNATQKPNQSGKPPNKTQNFGSQNAGVSGPSHYRNQRQNHSDQNCVNPQMKYIRQQNPNNPTGSQMVNMVTTQTSYQRQNYSGQNYGNPHIKYVRQQNPNNTGNHMVNTVTQTSYQKKNYSGQNPHMTSYTRQQNLNIDNRNIVTTQTSYQMKNYNAQRVQNNQNRRNPQQSYNIGQQSVNTGNQGYQMFNGIATCFNNLTIRDLRPNPFNMAFNQAPGTLRNMRPNPLNFAFNQAQSSNGSNTAMFNKHSSEVEEVDLTDDDVLGKWRQWEGGFSDNKPGFNFSVMSYNVLAQDLINQHSYLYRDHQPQFLSWDVRWNNILQEIKLYNPDIMCLQEVQETHIKDYFSTLSTLGYEGIYKKRTGVRVDGCAIYYKKDKITAVEHTTVEYRQPDVPLLNRDNVGLIVKFAPKVDSSKEFVVATTHLLYNPRREDVRLAQAQLLLTEVERISYKRNDENPSDSYLPVIITGDFNALPHSNLIKFLTTGVDYNNLAPQLLDHTADNPMLVTAALGISDNCQHVDLLINRENNVTIPRSEEQKVIKLCNTEAKKEKCISTHAVQLLGSGTLSHKFKLFSAYDTEKGTTNQDGVWIIVDYIFHSATTHSIHGRLRRTSRLGLPKNKHVRNVKIPNVDMGSDHFSLIVKFKLYF